MDVPGYQISRKIGQGGMASVYLAVQESLGREVALKVMDARFSSDEGLVDRFFKEGRIIAGLQHPQIVTIYDFGFRGGQYYFSMEYLSGGTLKERITSGISPIESVRMLRQVADALGYAHAQGVIHRDIKPENILFRMDGTLVLTDFGIAKRMDSTTQLTETNMSVGSPGYMSPEQINSRPLDCRADLYSLGVLFYEMLTRHLPYQADEMVGLAVMHCTAPIPTLSDQLSGFQPLIEWLLAKNPEGRPNSVAEFVTALDRISSGEKAGGSLTETVALYDARPAASMRSDSVPEEQDASVSQDPKPKTGVMVLLAFVLLALLVYSESTHHHAEGLSADAQGRVAHVERLLASCSARFPVAGIPEEEAANALDCYRQLSEYESDSADARIALDRLADRYADWVMAAIRDDRLDEAQAHLTDLASIRAQDARLSALAKDLRLAQWRRVGLVAAADRPNRPNWEAIMQMGRAEAAFRVEGGVGSPVAIGDSLDFEVASQQPGRLWVLSVDRLDRVNLIFPNDHAKENEIVAHKRLIFPPVDADWIIEAVEPPGDTIVAFLVIDGDVDLRQLMDSVPADRVGERLLQGISVAGDWGMWIQRLEILPD